MFFSFKQRDNPSDGRAKVGSIKYKHGTVFKYHSYGQTLYHGDRISKYTPKEYKSTKVVEDVVMKDGYIYAFSANPSQVLFRRMIDGTMKRLYFIKMMDKGDSGLKKKMKLGVYTYVDSKFYTSKSHEYLEQEMDLMWDGIF